MEFVLDVKEQEAPETADYVDAFVTLHDDGTVWVGVFVSLEKLGQLMRKLSGTRECRGGLYYWESGLVLMREPGVDAIFEAIQDMVEDSAIRRHLVKQDDEDDDA
ncbi:hypothetical protein [Sphaerisporangium krabiense]|uniref:Uncharacterized protein n=1 Tax=Sphaerisporangium krabiense TaxID=763782 RepID=A0A7W8Z1D4_9ACTN|nr:hypothetical protein [Sphaerisporangium krabiense]MBB5625647.1 hypothetical protein [Sphaerisporangium krabiense]